MEGHDAVMKYLIWDFDGTLAYREGQWPAWTQALMEVLDREIPGHGAALEPLRPFLRAGFPWHSPEIHHPHLGLRRRVVGGARTAFRRRLRDDRCR